jgi:hypothetical protein
LIPLEDIMADLKAELTDMVLSVLSTAHSKGFEEMLNEGMIHEIVEDATGDHLTAIRPKGELAKEILGRALESGELQKILLGRIESALDEIEYAIADDNDIELEDEETGV